MASIPTLASALLAVAALPTTSLAAAAAPAPVTIPVASETAERVEITAEDKKVLIGSFWAPKDARTSAPAVLLVHDAGGKRDDLAEIAERLFRQGFAVLALDLRHHGESLGQDKPWSELSEEEHLKVWNDSLRDLKAAASWIGKQTGVHATNISLLGDRAGCTLVTRYAARDENVRALVLLDPQVEQFGFNVSQDIGRLEGLPTYIAVSKESQSKAQTIAGTQEAAGNKFIEIAVFKGVSITPVVDKSMTAGIAKFLTSKAMPKKAEK